MGLKEFVGASGPALQESSKKVLEELTERLNAGIAAHQSREEVSAVFAEFWFGFLQKLTPESDGIERIAKFVMRSEIRRLGYQLFEPEIFDPKKKDLSLEDWTEVIDENLIAPEDLQPSL